MVLAYFMRKDYEAEIDTLLRNQEAQAETVKAQAEIAKAQAESIQAMRDIQTERRLEAEAMRDAEIARREASDRQLQEQNALIRQLLDLVAQQRNGNGSSPPAADPESLDQPEV